MSAHDELARQIAAGNRLAVELAAERALRLSAEAEATRLRGALQRANEDLTWADARIWPRVGMLEDQFGGPCQETEFLREILGPLRRAHRATEAALAEGSPADVERAAGEEPDPSSDGGPGAP